MEWTRQSDIAYLKSDTLKDGYAYQICARRANVGIWVKSRGAFVIARRKFGATYLFEEVHWDLDESFGTAKPLKEIEKAPFSVNEYNRLDHEILNYLIGLNERITGKKWNYESNDKFPL